jgi:pyridoxamine 5'-phosphate oxidase
LHDDYHPAKSAFSPTFAAKLLHMAITNIADIRTEYKKETLSEQDTAATPVEQFARWWDEALTSGIEEVNAMTLATATKEGIPSARIVLLKEFTSEGFVFFTNYESKKGMELLENPVAELVFFWKELERQVRISGTVIKVAAADSDAYFSSRPEGSRIGAWASPQSRSISSRQWLEAREQEIAQQFAGKSIERPPHWGGYLVQPRRVEFWQGRPSRLHDRILYTLQQDGSWTKERLAP